MPSAASSCHEAITAPAWPAQGRPFSWGFIWSSTCLHPEEVSPDLLQVCSRDTHQPYPSVMPAGKRRISPIPVPQRHTGGHRSAQAPLLGQASCLHPSWGHLPVVPLASSSARCLGSGNRVLARLQVPTKIQAPLPGAAMLLPRFARTVRAKRPRKARGQDRSCLNVWSTRCLAEEGLNPRLFP